MLKSQGDFAIAFRSGLDASNYGERIGKLASFLNGTDLISIQEYASVTNHTVLAQKSFALVEGQPYNFEVMDDGQNILFFIKGELQLSAISSSSSGNHVAFYSREMSSIATSVDFFSVTAVPEPSLVSLGLAGLFIGGSVRRIWKS